MKRLILSGIISILVGVSVGLAVGGFVDAYCTGSITSISQQSTYWFLYFSYVKK